MSPKPTPMLFDGAHSSVGLLFGLSVLATAISLGIVLSIVLSSFVAGFGILALVAFLATILLERQAHRGDGRPSQRQRPHDRARAHRANG